MIDLLLSRTDLSQLKPGSGESLLNLAAKHGHLDTVRRLIGELPGLKLDARPRPGSTALEMAAVNGHTDAIAHLLSHGADANNTGNFDGSACLHRAVLSGRRDVVETLAKHKVFSNTKLRSYPQVS